MGVRITVLIISFTLVYFGLVANIYNLQIGKGDYYSARAASTFSLSGMLEPERGDIYSIGKNGNRVPIAINRETPLIYADTREVDDVYETVERATQIITNIPKEELMEIFSKINAPYKLLVRNADEEMVKLLKEDPIPGVNINYESTRFYPFGYNASHVLGYVSLDRFSHTGVYGLERYNNDHLRGVPGEAIAGGFIPPKNGEDLDLTIDLSIQLQSERILKNLIEDYGAEGGTVIVQDPRTGKILSMANYPDFDPNNYSKYPISSFLNPAVQAVYEPGSVFKVLTMAAGIDSGKITPDTTYNDTGSMTLNNRTIRNWDLKAYGQVTMTNIIERSLNTGAAYAGKLIGREAFYDYLKKFGFRDITGIDLPAEVRGSIANLEEGARDINLATASFGQGISVTPMQLMTAMSSIANGGVMMRPYINNALGPQEIRRVISEETAKSVTDMMVSAVDKAGVARISGYTIAGKTGTAQVPDPNVGGYSDEVINTYVGFAPAYDSNFVILIKLDKPRGAPVAGLTVVPAFRELASFILNYYNIPPDNVN